MPASELEGTAGKVENHLFLGSILGREKAEVSEADVVDADLEVLRQDDTEEEVTLEEEGEEVPMVDLSQFDGESEEEVAEAESEDEEEEFELEEEGEAEIELGEEPEDEGLEFSLEEEDEEESDTPLPEPEVKLDLDVDLDDEPADDEIVFNLEDIDESDLVIEDDTEGEGQSGEMSSDESVPMDLAMEDGELVMDEKEKTDQSVDLPDIDL
jgi:hypothetical protein